MDAIAKGFHTRKISLRIGLRIAPLFANRCASSVPIQQEIFSSMQDASATATMSLKLDHHEASEKKAPQAVPSRLPQSLTSFYTTAVCPTERTLTGRFTWNTESVRVRPKIPSLSPSLRPGPYTPPLHLELCRPWSCPWTQISRPHSSASAAIQTRPTCTTQSITTQFVRLT